METIDSKKLTEEAFEAFKVWWPISEQYQFDTMPYLHNEFLHDMREAVQKTSESDSYSNLLKQLIIGKELGKSQKGILQKAILKCTAVLYVYEKHSAWLFKKEWVRFRESVECFRTDLINIWEEQ